MHTNTAVLKPILDLIGQQGCMDNSNWYIRCYCIPVIKAAIWLGRVINWTKLFAQSRQTHFPLQRVGYGDKTMHRDESWVKNWHVHCLPGPPGPVNGVSQLAPVNPTSQEHILSLLHTYVYMYQLLQCNYMDILIQGIAHSIAWADQSIGSSFTRYSGNLRDRDTASRQTDPTITTPCSIIYKSRTFYVHIGIRLCGEWPD